MSEFTWSQTAATNANADASINWAEGQSPGSVNNSARAMMAARAKARDDLAGVGPSNAVITTAGTSTAYTVTSNQSLTTLTNGFTITFRPHASNTGTTTLAVDGLTAKPLRYKTATELVSGDVLIGHTYTATYFEPTDEWLLKVSPVPALAIGTGQIAADAVTGAKIADDSIDSEHYVDGSIDTAHIADDQVTFAKMQNITTARILGRTTASSGNIEELTAGTGLTLAGGSLSVTSPSGFVFIETQTAESASATLNFTTLSSTYHTFLFRLIDIRPSSDGDQLMMRVRLASGGSFQNSGYACVAMYLNTAFSSVAVAVAATAGIILSAGDVGSAAGDARYSGECKISPHNNTRAVVTGQGGYGESIAGRPTLVQFSGFYDTAGEINAVQFRFNSGDIASGSIHMYGIRV